MNYTELADLSLAGRELSREQCHQILKTPDPEILELIGAAWRVRHHHFGNRVQVQVLSNAKSGQCREDCHYCSQSAISKADINRHALLAEDKLVDEAKEAVRIGARRFCIALSGRVVTRSESAALAGIVRAIKKETGLDLCCSLGFLEPEQAGELKAAGLDRVNHNLNTSERYYPSICTTHRYEERVKNIAVCQEAGMEICSGGIIGMGETDDDIIDLLMALREIGPQAVPLNFLVPIEGTPMENQDSRLDPVRCLRVVALARFLHPAIDLRLAGGREYHLRSLQPMALYAANSIFVDGYLTTGGQPSDSALAMIADLGFVPEVEGAACG